jgi:formyltetrahydrofolate-dependent phosphoribosylglycinamide formyltransferase
MPKPPLNLAVFISGSGTTLQNLADRIAAGELKARITCVVASRPDVFGLQRAARLNLPAAVVDRRAYNDGAAFSRKIDEIIGGYPVDLVCLAGFLCLWRIGPRYRHRVMNIHPALLPKFGGRGMHGLKVHQAVLDAGETISGCTVHFADNDYDHGPIILQRTCPVLPGDTVASLAARVFEQECIAYPQAIRLFAENRLKIHGPTVEILPEKNRELSEGRATL